MSANKQNIVTIRPMYLAKPNAAAYLSLSESAFDALVSRGDISKPRKLSPSASRLIFNKLTSMATSTAINFLCKSHGLTRKPSTPSVVIARPRTKSSGKELRRADDTLS